MPGPTPHRHTSTALGIEDTVTHLTQSRIAAALAAAEQAEGEHPWHLLLTKPPMTYTEYRQCIVLEQNPDLRGFAGIDEATCSAEASRARIVQELARRDGYADALAVTEQLLSTSPVLPVSTEIRLAPWDDAPLICWGFHRDSATVHKFGAYFGLPVTERPHNTEGTSVYTSAEGLVSGVRVEAYALVDVPAEQLVTAGA